MRKKLLSLSAALGLALVAAVPLANAQSSFTFSSSNPVETTTVTTTATPPTTTSPTSPPTTTEPTPPPPAPEVTITDFQATSNLIGIGNGTEITLSWEITGDDINDVDRFDIGVFPYYETQETQLNCAELLGYFPVPDPSDSRSFSMTSPSWLNHAFCIRALDETGSVLATATLDEEALDTDFYQSVKPIPNVQNVIGGINRAYLTNIDYGEACFDGTFFWECFIGGYEWRISTDPTFPPADPTTVTFEEDPPYDDIPGVTGCNYFQIRLIGWNGIRSQWSDPHAYMRGSWDDTWGMTCDAI